MDEEKNIGFFSDNNGNNSSLRAMAMILVIAGVILIFADFVNAILSHRSDIGINTVSAALGMIGLAISGKVIQKGIEK